MKKKLGITDTGKVQRYIDWFTSEDTSDEIEVVVLTKGSDDYKSCSGILLTGGIDIHPSLYDGPEEYPNADAFDLERDEFETAVYEFAKKNGIPVLGICRGLQLVNVIEGGTLVQDLGEGNAIHKKAGEVDKQHAVVVSQRSLLAEIVDATKGNVNSAHHQAADPGAIGRALMVNAVSEQDGHSVVEGLEFKDKTNKGFMLCVQWHPERMPDKEKRTFSESIKQAFLDAIREL